MPFHCACGLLERDCSHPNCHTGKPKQKPIDWERIARVQDAKLRAMTEGEAGFKKLCEVLDRYDTENAALLKEALDRINDMLKGDDGQAFKEARKFVERVRGKAAGYSDIVSDGGMDPRDRKITP